MPVTVYRENIPNEPGQREGNIPDLGMYLVYGV